MLFRQKGLKGGERLSKKFPLKAELAELDETLTNQPDIGTPLGNNTYKIRLQSEAKEKVKAAGTYHNLFINENKKVYLLTIYDKSELDNIDDKTLKNIIQSLNLKN